ncbi:MAG: hypothetical protein JZU47_10225 [Prolixibacteraceae bacterium]|nr:hypothetical protein [Prolixibacteraceae bacterium]
MKQYFAIITFILVFFSCQNREWNNPFDPECPKVMWTPTDFVAKQQGNSINLTWVQGVKNITGFRIDRKIEGETDWKEVVSPAKTANTWTDAGITGGKLYEYHIVAIVGSNESNYAWTQIKPLLTATLTTANPSSIKSTSALLGGTITNDGGATITERGVCWATTANPTTSNNKLAIGSGTGSFNNTITGLTANTTYYIRAYAINSQGTAYGNELNFKCSLPLSLSTSNTYNITSNSATLGGNIISDGNETVTERGVCYSTYINPTTSNTKLAIGSGIGSFSNIITGLTANTTYFIRAYAINSQGTAYGNELSFKTFYGEVTDADGNVYPTIKIGNQIWMAENLKTTKYNDGTTIPNVTDNTTWAALKTGAYCYYNNDAINYKATYGTLYNWYAVNTNRLCPAGWHVPTDSEWTTLTTYIGGESVAGGKLKGTGTTHWLTPNTGATNEVGFTALPAGYRGSNGTFYYIGYGGYWWSSTEYLTNYVWHWYVFYSDSGVRRYGYTKEHGFSVRCVRDY